MEGGQEGFSGEMVVKDEQGLTNHVTDGDEEGLSRQREQLVQRQRGVREPCWVQHIVDPAQYVTYSVWCEGR